MTDHQLYLIIGVPSCFNLMTAVTAVLWRLSLRRAFKRIEASLDAFDESLRTQMKAYAADSKALVRKTA